MIYPSELSDFIYGKLEAKYISDPEKAKNSLYADKKQNLINLGTYFPRSFIEINKIFTDLTQNSHIYESLKRKKEIYILDIGSGTGGSLLGLLWFLKEFNQNNEETSIHILSIDGNHNALEIQKRLLDKFCSKNITYVRKQSTISNNNLNDVLDQAIKGFTVDMFDIIISSKFVNEIYRDNQPENEGLYENNYQKNKGMYGNIIDASSNYLAIDGIFLLSDVTDPIKPCAGANVPVSFSEYELYLPKIMNSETIEYLNNATAKLKPIIPLSCALWHDICKAPFCFTQNIIKLEFSQDSKRDYWRKGIKDDPCKITYKIFAHTAFADSILKQIVGQQCYKIADKTRCELGTSNYDNIHDGKNADDYMDAFSLAPKK